MGWLKWNSNLSPQTTRLHDLNERSECWEALKADSIHTERVDVVSSNDPPTNKRQYVFHPTSLPDEGLPFIPGDIVRTAKTASDRLWIVIDNIVLDCTDFVHVHPGGKTVIESFNGEDCSWQFWRFHSRSNMEMDGRPLRIGRTAGVANRFKEKPRFLGLRRLGADEF